MEDAGDDFEPSEELKLEERDFLDFKLDWNRSMPIPREGGMRWEVIGENEGTIDTRIVISGDLIDMMNLTQDNDAEDNTYIEDESHSIENLWSGRKEVDLWDVEEVKKNGEFLGGKKLRTTLGAIKTHHYRSFRGENRTDVYLEVKTGFPVRIKYKEGEFTMFTLTISDTNIEFLLNQFQPICC